MKGMIKISVKNKFAVVGIDSRLKYTADFLSESGYGVSVFPNENSSFAECVSGADYILLGNPVSLDGRYIFGLGDSNAVSITKLLESAKSNSVLLGGNIGDSVCGFAEKCGVKVIDYTFSEALNLHNAIYTAEASIGIMIENCERSLSECDVNILGFGRVGRALGVRLHALGANVRICARSERDLALASCMSLECVDISDGFDAMPYCDVLFNTVPSVIVGEKEFGIISPDTLIVELASSPGGFDKTALEKSENKYICARGLPGKVFPESAGNALAEAVLGFIEGGDGV